MEQIKLPVSEITIEIGSAKKQYKIKYPTNGQLIDIERMKIQLTSGTHKEMLFGVSGAQQAYLLVEAIATFTVLIPSLNKDLAVLSLLDLNPYQSKTIIDAYQNIYFPWMQGWDKVLNPENPKEEEESNEG